MVAFKKILAVAHYETKTLFRNNYFRIFTTVFIVCLIYLNYFYFLGRFRFWQYRGISSSIPYFNLSLLNVFMAFIGIFVASDYYHRDKTCDSTDSIYTRSMKNAEYVLGKFIGVFVFFCCPLIIVLLISLVFNVVFVDDVTFLPKVYVYYTFLICIPTFVFIIGASFLLMALIRNQPVTIMLLLGYFLSAFFYLGFKYPCLFDSMANNIPFTYSDIVGFGSISKILIHRAMYFLFGLGFTFTTVLLIRRLPQSKRLNHICILLSIVCISGGAVLGSVYLSEISANRELRQEMAIVNKHLADEPILTITDCKLDLIHKMEKIEVKANITYKNDTDSTINTFIFSLNPGLKILNIENKSNDLSFSRNLHIITVELSAFIKTDDRDSLTVHYEGTIDDNTCYIDIDEKEREEDFNSFLFSFCKLYSFILPDYVLLTPENCWYPIAGVPFGSVYPKTQKKDFVNFELRVTTNGKLTALSQGKSKKTGEGKFIFSPEYPLPQLSLIIGNYEKKTITVRDIDYNIFVIDGHDNFSQYFNKINKNLSQEISFLKQDFESKINLDYPYKRFSIIEVPIHFYSYDRDWTVYQETVQPEQIFVHEKCMLNSHFDFKRSLYFRQKYDKRVMTPEEVQREIFRTNVKIGLLGNSYLDYGKRRGIMGDPARKPPIILNIMRKPAILPTVGFLPQYFNFGYFFNSDDYPVFGNTFEHYFNIRTEMLLAGSQYPEWKLNACWNLRKHTMLEILAAPGKKQLKKDVVKIKTDQLYSYIYSEIGKDNFNKFLLEFLAANPFKTIEVGDFLESLQQQFDFDLTPFLKKWSVERSLPGFIFTPLKCQEFLDNERIKYQMMFKVYNPEPADGIFSVSCYTKSYRLEERFIFLKGKQAKEISIVSDEEPFYAAQFNTLLSLNLPTVFKLKAQKVTLNKINKIFDGERILDEPPPFGKPGEIIVDDDDPGFEILTHPKEGFLLRLFHKNKTEHEVYLKIRNVKKLREWQRVVNEDYYGVFLKSAHKIKAGNGDQRVAWNTELPESGEYEVFFSTPVSMFSKSNWSFYMNHNIIVDFNFLVHHDDGIEEVSKKLEMKYKNWVPIGTYYFSQGPAKIELTDKSNGRVVYADAVKWVRK